MCVYCAYNMLTLYSFENVQKRDKIMPSKIGRYGKCLHVKIYNSMIQTTHTVDTFDNHKNHVIKLISYIIGKTLIARLFFGACVSEIYVPVVVWMFPRGQFSALRMNYDDSGNIWCSFNFYCTSLSSFLWISLVFLRGIFGCMKSPRIFSNKTMQ